MILFPKNKSAFPRVESSVAYVPLHDGTSIVKVGGLRERESDVYQQAVALIDALGDRSVPRREREQIRRSLTTASWSVFVQHLLGTQHAQATMAMLDETLHVLKKSFLSQGKKDRHMIAAARELLPWFPSSLHTQMQELLGGCASVGDELCVSLTRNTVTGMVHVGNATLAQDACLQCSWAQFVEEMGGTQIHEVSATLAHYVQTIQASRHCYGDMFTEEEKNEYVRGALFGTMHVLPEAVRKRVGGIITASTFAPQRRMYCVLVRMVLRAPEAGLAAFYARSSTASGSGGERNDH